MFFNTPLNNNHRLSLLQYLFSLPLMTLLFKNAKREDTTSLKIFFFNITLPKMLSLIAVFLIIHFSLISNIIF